MTDRRLVVLCMTLALAGGAGCSGSDAQRQAAARVAVTTGALSASITQVTVTVSQGDGPAFTPIVAPLSQAGNDWSGFITGIPAGPGRQFDVVALDATGATVAKGTAKAEVRAGGTATVAIVLGQATTGNPYQNNAPVIDYISASETLVKPGASVRLGASAHDPDPTDKISYAWAATCGTIASPSAAAVDWVAPATPGRCQVSVSVTDNRGASVAAYLVIEVGVTTGDVLVTVTGGTNVAPVISGMAAQVTYGDLTTGNLLVNAMDPDGDALTYVWSSDCTGLTFKTTAPNSLVAPSFSSTDTGKACVLTVTVTDAMGSHTVGVIKIPPRPVFNLAPVITSTVQPTVDLTDPLKAEPVNPGDSILLGVQARDPEGQALTFTWTASAGTLNGQVDQVTSPGKSVAVFHVPATIPAGLQVTVKVSDPLGESNSHVFLFKAAGAAGNPCTGKPDGTACTTGSLCTTGQTCTAGTCGGGQAKVCTASDACHAAGTCDAATGTCSNPPVADGTACNDGNLCTTPDVCAAGVCVGAAKCAAGQTCDPVSGACSAAPACSPSVPCVAPDACHDAGACTAGVCGTPPPKANGVTCAGPDACQIYACQSGACTGSPKCAAPQSCTGGVCGGSGGGAVTLAAAKDLGLGNFVGLALDRNGVAYASGVLLQPTKVFDGISLTSAGAGDVFLARYDPVTHSATWARSYGDAADQQPTGVAVTADGTVAAIGQFLGTIAPGVVNAGNTAIDFLLAVNAADGSVKWGKSFNEGVSGTLLAVAANPAQNRIAVCGYASQAATDLVPGATYGGGARDIVLGVFDSAGTRLWSRQIGGAQEEECDAIAIDDAGDVYAAGKYDGALTFTGVALPSPGSSFRRWMWIAKFNGADGTATAQVSFGSGNGIFSPQALALDPTGKLVVSGNFTNTLSFGASPAPSLTSAGGPDAFVAKLDPAAATPFTAMWAVRMGGIAADEARGVAVDSAGNVVAAGLFNGTTTGAATLTAPNSVAAAIFVLKLSGSTGATISSAGYGNATNTVNANKVVINRQGTGSLQDLLVFGGEFGGALDFGPPTSAISTAGTDAFLVFGK
jgi:hypothetical protein